MSERDVIGVTSYVTAGETYGDADGFIITSGAETHTPGILYNGSSGATTLLPGNVSGGTILEGGTLYVYDSEGGGKLRLQDIVLDGGIISSPQKYGKTSKLYTISNLTVFAGTATLYTALISGLTMSGGVVRNTWNGGNISGGTIYGGALSGGGNVTITDLIVSESEPSTHTLITVSSGAILSNVTLRGGTLRFKDRGGTLSGSIISGGTAILSGNYYSSNGTWNSKFYNDNKIYGGTVYLSGGHVTNLAVSGGEVIINTNDNSIEGGTGIKEANASSGVYLSGTIELASAAQMIVVDSGGTASAAGGTVNYGWFKETTVNWKFNLTEVTPGNTALINDFGFTDTANATYTITVNADQAAGTYQLAGNAGELSETSFSLTVGTADSVSLNIGESYADTTNHRRYTLNLVGDENKTLTLNVENTQGAITIIAGDYTGLYDGQAHNGGFSYSGELVAGDEIVAEVNSLTNAGTVTSVIQSYQIMRGKVDVTSEYPTIYTATGTITINQRAINVTSPSAWKQHDGSALTATEYSVTGDGFVTGEGASISVTGKQTNVGFSNNTISVVFNDGTSSDNYKVTPNEGILDVTKGAYRDVIGSSTTIYGDQVYGDADGFVVTSDAEKGNAGVFQVGYVDGGTLYGGGTVCNAVIGSGGVMQINSGTGMHLENITLSGGSLCCPDTVAGKATGWTVFSGNSGLTVSDCVRDDVLCKVSATTYTQSGGDVRIWKFRTGSGQIFGGKLGVYGGAETDISKFDVFGGEVNFSSGDVSNLTVSNGTVNLGTEVAAHVRIIDAKISGGVVNVAQNYLYKTMWSTNVLSNTSLYDGTLNVSGGYISGLNVSGGTINLTTFAISEETAKVSSRTYLTGALNLSGGTMLLDSSTNAGYVVDTDANWKFDLSTRTTTDAAFINDFCFTNAASYTITVKAAQTSGTYTIAGNAATAMSGKSVTISVDGRNAGTISAGESILDNASHRGYSLALDKDNNLTLSVAELQTADSPGAIPIAAGETVAAATWGTTTKYATTTTHVCIGNGTADNTVLLIDNAGAANTANTYVYGGTAGGDMDGEADIRLYQGNIGAIMGGAQNAANKVGAVDIQIGGGTTTATTGVVYGGGFGDVTGTTKITTSKGAGITGQLYGGACNTTANANVTAGAIDIDLLGGTLASDVIGGARTKATGDNTTTVGDVSITVDGASLTGGANSCVYGGGWVFGTHNTDYDSVAGAVTITVNSDVAAGSGNGRGIFGGAFASGGTYAKVASVSINVTGGTASNIYGGGWAQKGAHSDVAGAVTINVTNATVNSIYGGGAHGIKGELTAIGETSVGSTAITINGGTVGSVFAAGQTSGDSVTGTGTVTLQNNANVNFVYGCGLKAGAVCTGGATLTLNNYTGTISKAIRGFDSISITGDSTAVITASDGDVENENWKFDLTEKSSTDTAALIWAGGSFEAEEKGTNTMLLTLGDTATAWTVCDLSVQDDDAVSGAFTNVGFTLNIGGTSYGYTLGKDINVGAWAGWKLDYDETSGKLAFSTFVAAV